MNMYYPYVHDNARTYRRLPWTLDRFQAEHAVSRAMSMKVGCKGHAIILNDKNGLPLRDTQGNIILVNNMTLIRVGYIKEIKCETCHISPLRLRPMPVIA